MSQDYLPDIKGRLARSGFITVDSGDTFKSVLFLALFGLFWSSISVFMFTMAWMDEEWFAVAFLSLFVLIGLVIAYMAYKQFKIWQRFAPGELEVSPWPLRPGSEARFTYRRAPRKATRMRYVAARLELEEKVQYQQGTDLRTATHTVWSHELGERDLSTRNRLAGVEEAYEYTLPAHLPPSFSAPRNELIWRFVADLHYGGSSEDDSTFDLRVEPRATSRT